MPRQSMLVCDGFNRGNEVLKIPWLGGLTFNGSNHDSLQIVRNGVVQAAVINNDSSAFFLRPSPIPGNQWASMVLRSIAGADIVAPRILLRNGPWPQVNGYQFSALRNLGGVGTSRISKVTLGTTFADLVADSSVTWAAGDGLLGTAIDTALTLYRRAAGTSLWVQVCTTTDGTHTSGQVGMLTYVGPTGALSDSEISDFQAGGFDLDPDGMGVSGELHGKRRGN